MATPEVAYMNYEMPGINEQFVTQMSNIYQQRLLLSQLVWVWVVGVVVIGGALVVHWWTWDAHNTLHVCTCHVQTPNAYVCVYLFHLSL